MKKLLTLVFGLILFYPITAVKALNIDPSTGVYDTETTLDIQLTAKPPVDNLTAVSVRLKIDNGTFVSFTPASNTSWIGITKDCTNNQYITDDLVCFTVAQNSEITDGEVLGTLKVTINGSQNARISKIEGNKYSDGTTTFDDLGDAGIYFTSASLASAPVSSDVNSVYSASALNIIIIILVAFVALGIIAAVVILLRKRQLTSTTPSSKNKVLAIVAVLSLLVIGTIAVGLSLNNNQAPEQSSAYVLCSEGQKRCTSDKRGYQVCGSNEQYGSVVTCGPLTECTSSGSGVSCNAIPNNCSPGSTKCGDGHFMYKCDSDGTHAYDFSRMAGTCCPGYNYNSSNNTCAAANTGSTGNNSGNSTSNSTGSSTNSTGNNGNTGTTNNTNSTGNNNSTGSTGNTGGTGSSTTTTGQSVCGGSCNTNSDCVVPQYGIQPTCSNHVCINPVCPNDFNHNALCACKTNNAKCGDKCGSWSDGAHPLCGDGVSSCSWLNGPACGGTNATYCVPTKAPTGYTINSCTAQATYQYLKDSNGAVLTTQAQLQAACAQLSATKKCYRCSVSTTDGNACESTDVATSASCPTGYTENSNCAAAATGGSCPVDSTRPLASCGNLDSNGDTKLTVIDFASFALVYNNSCTNTGFTPNACGSRDVNADGKIDVIDFAHFAKYYGKDTCIINPL